VLLEQLNRPVHLAKVTVGNAQVAQVRAFGLPVADLAVNR
jgi:hypothetical protein